MRRLLLRAPGLVRGFSRAHGWDSAGRRGLSTGPDRAATPIPCGNRGEAFPEIHWAPAIELDPGRKVAGLAEAAVVGTSGDTVALATVALGEKGGAPCRPPCLGAALVRACSRSDTTPAAVVVDYRQRHHAVGKIPHSSLRTDNGRPSAREVLSARAIDRSLRPLLLRPGCGTSGGGETQAPPIHLSCSIQAYPTTDRPGASAAGGGHPLPLALNAASLALGDKLRERLAAAVLCLMEDGSVLVNPSVSLLQNHRPGHGSGEGCSGVVGELLYAGTRDSVVMVEFSGNLPEDRLLELMRLAHDAIQPVIETQEQMMKHRQNEEYPDDSELRKQLGIVAEDDASDVAASLSSQQTKENECRAKADAIYEEAMGYVGLHLGDALLRLFGAETEKNSVGGDQATGQRKVAIHSEEKDGPLVGKSIRGRREALVRNEIKRLLERFEPADPKLAKEYRKALEDNKSILGTLGDALCSQMLREAMAESSILHKSRADGRRGNGAGGNHTIRPISMDVPALPGVVHGSSMFARGETQVLCTTTLGPPRDGILRRDPFEPITDSPESFDEYNPDAPSKTLPVGSLRYLRSQEHLESDLNSRKVLADREQTGDSGTLRERHRAFLQYDFPPYCNGEAQTRSSSASRREIGHGALAEKAILPILPPANKFPYTIRMTSEVTSSNGSSSMATICGVVLSLLDAGVPISAPVAGVSVGLVQDAGNESYQLLLDISGTEDHYGQMDFKIAGTAESVTAMQLDVKQPLSFAIVADALQLAKEGRTAILEEMKTQSDASSEGVISDLSPRPELKSSAPRCSVVKFDPARKKDLLGPGGVVIRQMEDRFNVSLDLTQEGQCLLFGDDREMVRKAKTAVMDLVSDVEVGVTYEGIIIEIRDFGIIVELLRNKEGLCHVSELSSKKEIRNHSGGTKELLNKSLRIGQKIEVVCIAVDPVQGTIRLRPASTKEAF